MTPSDPRPWMRCWADETQACIEYLHGGIVGDAPEAVCLHEYARESAVLREVAAVRERLRQQHRGEVELCAAVARAVVLESPARGWIAWHPWPWIWRCGGFPSRPWPALSSKDRARMAAMIEPGGVRPLASMDAPLSEALRGAGMQARGRWSDVTFTLDWSESRHRQVQRFSAWLNLIENKARLREHARDPKGLGHIARDRLKDLAAVRLFEGLPDGRGVGDSPLERFNRLLRFASERRKSSRPFHDSRRGQCSPGQRVDAPLYADQQQFANARARVHEHLVSTFPSETTGTAGGAFTAAVLRAMRQGQKVSRKKP